MPCQWILLANRNHWFYLTSGIFSKCIFSQQDEGDKKSTVLRSTETFISPLILVYVQELTREKIVKRGLPWCLPLMFWLFSYCLDSESCNCFAQQKWGRIFSLKGLSASLYNRAHYFSFSGNMWILFTYFHISHIFALGLPCSSVQKVWKNDHCWLSAVSEAFEWLQMQPK